MEPMEESSKNTADSNDNFVPVCSARTSFWQQLVLYVKYVFKSRWVDKQNISVHCIALILAVVYFVSSSQNISTIPEDKIPKPLPLGNATSLLFIMSGNYKHGMNWAPDSEFVKDFAPKNSFWFEYKVFPNIDKMADSFRKNLDDDQLGIVIDKDGSNGEYDIRTMFSGPKTPPTLASSYVSERLLLTKNPKTNLNLTISNFPYPPLKADQNLSAFISLYLVVIYMFIMIPFCFYFLLQRKTKLVYLMEISGLRDSVMVIGLFICNFIESIPVIVLSTFMIVFVSNDIKGSNFFIIFMHNILYDIGINLFMFFIFFLVESEGGGGIVLTSSYLLAGGQVTLFMFSDVIPMEVLHLCMALFPESTSHAFYATVSRIKGIYGPLSFSNANKSFDFSIGECFGFQFLNIFLYIIGIIIVVLCKNRQWGYAPLGWAGLFNIKKWKKLFGIDESKQIDTSKYDAISIKELVKTYKTGDNQIKALKLINLDIKEGETIALIGPNGSGKSTLFNSITGSITVDSGRIEIYGNNILEDNSELYRSLGYVAQENILVHGFDVEENLLLFGRIRGISEDVIQSDIDYLISKLNLEGGRHTASDDLSGGMKRKLCVAIALMQRPSILIMDEPTAGIDAQSRQTIWKTLDCLKRTTALISCHSLEEAESVATKILVMSSGNIVMAGSPAEIRKEVNCGYMIKVSEGECTNEKLLEVVREIIPEAEIKENSVHVPIDLRVSDAIVNVENKKEEIGIKKYTVHVENLEYSLIKLTLDGTE